MSACPDGIFLSALNLYQEWCIPSGHIRYHYSNGVDHIRYPFISLILSVCSFEQCLRDLPIGFCYCSLGGVETYECPKPGRG